MRIKYLQLSKPLNIPGQGGPKKISANGLDGAYVGMVKTITRDDVGYILHIAGGANRGYYHVPFVHVDHAGLIEDLPRPEDKPPTPEETSKPQTRKAKAPVAG